MLPGSQHPPGSVSGSASISVHPYQSTGHILNPQADANPQDRPRHLPDTPTAQPGRHQYTFARCASDPVSYLAGGCRKPTLLCACVRTGGCAFAIAIMCTGMGGMGMFIYTHVRSSGQVHVAYSAQMIRRWHDGRRVRPPSLPCTLHGCRGHSGHRQGWFCMGSVSRLDAPLPRVRIT